MRLRDVFTTLRRIEAKDAARVRTEVDSVLRKRFVDNVEVFTRDDFQRVGHLLYGEASWLRLARRWPVQSAIAAARAARLTDLLARSIDPR